MGWQFFGKGGIAKYLGWGGKKYFGVGVPSFFLMGWQFFGARTMFLVGWNGKIFLG